MPAKETKRTTATAGRKTTKTTSAPTGPTLVAETCETKPARRTTKKAAAIAPTHDQIRERAFRIFMGRNGAPGDAHGDWIEAERQLVSELNA